MCWLVSYVHESNGLCKGQTDTTGFMTQRKVSSLCEHFRQIHVIFVVLRDIVDTSCWQCSFAASTTVWIPSEVEMSCRRTRQVFSFHWQGTWFHSDAPFSDFLHFCCFCSPEILSQQGPRKAKSPTFWERGQNWTWLRTLKSCLLCVFLLKIDRCNYILSLCIPPPPRCFLQKNSNVLSIQEQQGAENSRGETLAISWVYRRKRWKINIWRERKTKLITTSQLGTEQNEKHEDAWMRNRLSWRQQKNRTRCALGQVRCPTATSMLKWAHIFPEEFGSCDIAAYCFAAFFAISASPAHLFGRLCFQQCYMLVYIFNLWGYIQQSV